MIIFVLNFNKTYLFQETNIPRIFYFEMIAKELLALHLKPSCLLNSFYRTKLALGSYLMLKNVFLLLKFSRIWFWRHFFSLLTLSAQTFPKPPRSPPSATPTHASFGKRQKKYFGYNELKIFFCYNSTQHFFLLLWPPWNNNNNSYAKFSFTLA